MTLSTVRPSGQTHPGELYPIQRRIVDPEDLARASKRYSAAGAADSAEAAPATSEARVRLIARNRCLIMRIVSFIKGIRPTPGGRSLWQKAPEIHGFHAGAASITAVFAIPPTCKGC